MKTKDFSKIFFSSILALFVFFSLGVIGYSIYYYNNKPLTSQTYYLNTLNYTDPEDDSKYAFEVNMFNNTRKNGRYCFEFISNYYTDSEIPENPGEYKNVYSSGVQFVDKFSYEKHYDSAFMNWGESFTYYTLGNKYFYNKSYDNTSYSAIKNLDDLKYWILDCNGKLVTMQIKGNVHTGVVHWLGHWDYFNYDFNYMLVKLEKSVKSLVDGQHILQFDLSEFFTFREYNEETKQYDKPVKGDLDFAIVDIKINKTSNGLIDAKQSIFNLVKNDADYSAVDSVNDYYSYKSTYYLNEFDFDIVSNSNGTCYITLKDDIAGFISTFIDLDIICEINLDSTYFVGNYCLGFAENAIKGVNINYCTINSNSPTTFYLNNNAVNIVVDSNITIEGGGL